MAGPGPGAQSNPLNAFLAAFLTDVSANLSPSWQCVDIAATALKIALRGKDMQKAPATVATLQSCLNTLTTLIDARTTGTTSTSPGTPSVAASANSADTGSADADSQPAAPTTDDSGGTGDQ